MFNSLELQKELIKLVKLGELDEKLDEPENGVRLLVALHFTELRQDLFKFIGSFKMGWEICEEG